MPEGDTLFRTARTLDRALRGGIVTRFESVFPALNRVHHDHPLTGRTIESVDPMGKHVLMRFSGGLVLRTHMRMRGSWHIYRPGEKWWLPHSEMRVSVATPAFEAVAFRVPVAEFIEGTAALAGHRDLGALGPDLLDESFDAAEAARRIRAGGTRAIEETLLDQRVVAGIGNIFKSEILHASRIHPYTPAALLAAADLDRLLAHGRRLLRANVSPASPAAIVTYSGLRREDHDDGLWVYGRSGRPCRTCGTPIAYRRSGPHARSTYWCPKCQPEAAAVPS